MCFNSFRRRRKNVSDRGQAKQKRYADDAGRASKISHTVKMGWERGRGGATSSVRIGGNTDFTNGWRGRESRGWGQWLKALQKMKKNRHTRWQGDAVKGTPAKMKPERVYVLDFIILAGSLDAERLLVLLANGRDFLFNTVKLERLSAHVVFNQRMYSWVPLQKLELKTATHLSFACDPGELKFAQRWNTLKNMKGCSLGISQSFGWRIAVFLRRLIVSRSWATRN